MPTLNAGSNVTLPINAYGSITINTLGPVLVEAVSGLGLTAGKIEEFQGGRTFGPFSQAGQLKITSQGGQTAQYEVASGSKSGTPILLAQNALAASITGTVTETVLATIVLPGGIMGPNGSIRILPIFSATNSANNKTLRVYIGATAFLAATITASTLNAPNVHIRNRGQFNSQFNFSAASNIGLGNSGAAITAGAINTAVDQLITITAQLTNTGETITLEGYSIEVLPS